MQYRTDKPTENYLKGTFSMDIEQELSIMHSMSVNLENSKSLKRNQITFASLFFIFGVVFGGGSVGAFTNLYANKNAILMN